ncbi:MAG TPA: ABC transporter ATP-binding protein [Lachnospiraceae bacterium]
MIKTIGAQIKEFKKDSILTPVYMILEVIIETMIPLMMASIIDGGVEKGNIRHIYFMGGLMFLAALASLVTGALGGKHGARASAGLAKNLREEMFRKIQNFSFSNIDRYNTAGLVTRMTTDVSNIQNAYQMILRMVTRAPASLIFSMIMAFSINARLSLVYLVAVVFLTLAIGIMLRFAMKYFTQVFEKYDDLNASVQENVSSIRVVKSFVREEYEKSRFYKASNNVYKLFVKAENVVVFAGPIMQLTVYATIMTICWLGAKMIVQNTLTTGELMGLLTYCMNILMSLMMLAMVFVMVTMSIASGRRISEVLEEEPSITNPQNPVYTVKDGSVEFSHVNFTYNEQKDDFILSDIHLSIKSGETIGIIGGTGSSKSSLVNLISRLYDVTQGAVFVGGENVKNYDLESLRNAVSVVLQKNVLFSGSILENLRWGDENASREDCLRACKLACAHEFIEKMPNGYDTHIEQGGSNVSGGQKQRLCIARALLKKPKILILDDSTSAVDTATDAKIRKALKEEIPDTTKIIIAQRISSIAHADRILVLDDGKISGLGSHELLLETNKIYREVYESQNTNQGEKGGEE